MQIVKDSEGCRLTAYRCAAGVLTVGWGHTGPDVTEGMKITQDFADLLLAADIRWAEKAVEKYVTVEITDNQFSALVSLVFNIGTGNFLKSRVFSYLQDYNYIDASAHFYDHVYARGEDKPIRGLVIRREREKTLFES
jgi:lysozyme